MARAPRPILVGLLLAALLLGGCTQTIVIPRPEPIRYAEPLPGRLACQIPTSTAHNVYSLWYWYYVYLQVWDVYIGQVFRSYAEAHLGGAFEEVTWPSTRGDIGGEGEYRLVLELAEYSLETFRANVAVRAQLFGPRGELLYEHTVDRRFGSPRRGELLPEIPVIVPSVRVSTDLALRESLGEIVREVRETIRETTGPGATGAPAPAGEGRR